MTPLDEVREQVPRWRKRGYEPHMVVVPDKDYEPYPVVFRVLTRKEYEELSQPVKPGVETMLGPLFTGLYDEIIQTALLYPKELPEDLPAATDGIVADAILEASAWINPDRLVEGLAKSREEVLGLNSFLVSRVYAAFPTMTPDKVKDMTFPEFIKFVAYSEILTGVQVDLEPWLSPDTYRKRMDREERRIRLREKGMAEAGQNMPTNPRDAALFAAMMKSAEESRNRLSERHGPVDFQKDNAEIQALGIMPKLRMPKG